MPYRHGFAAPLTPALVPASNGINGFGSAGASAPTALPKVDATAIEWAGESSSPDKLRNFRQQLSHIDLVLVFNGGNNVDIPFFALRRFMQISEKPMVYFDAR